MAYGTPERVEDIPAYYTHIRRGSPPPADLLAELAGRYRAVGGPTALNRITREQAEALERSLAGHGVQATVQVGFKHVSPFIGEAVERLAVAGVTRAVGLVLAPHYSLRSVAEYIEYAEAARPADLKLEIVRSWHDHPGFIDFLADRLVEALHDLGDPHVVFTAHSVPASVLARGDPYPAEIARTCERIAARAGVRRWTFAYQSAGRTGETWLGPDIARVLGRLADGEETAVVLQPVGFVSDHLEILYDLDIEARAAAERHGLAFARTRMPNADPVFIEVLADIVVSRLAGARGRP